MADEHTRESLLHLVERSITAERLVTELEKVFAVAGGPPKVLRMDNGTELVSQALQRFCKGKVGLSYIPPEHPVRGPSGHRRLQDEHNHRHRHSGLGYRTPAEYAARCSHTHYPVDCEIN
jgi:transposase InsO family protein